MKVYIVLIEYDGEDFPYSEMLGIYASRKLAEERAEEYIKRHYDECQEYSIDEEEVIEEVEE